MNKIKLTLLIILTALTVTTASAQIGGPPGLTNSPPDLTNTNPVVPVHVDFFGSDYWFPLQGLTNGGPDWKTIWGMTETYYSNCVSSGSLTNGQISWFEFNLQGDADSDKFHSHYMAFRLGVNGDANYVIGAYWRYMTNSVSVTNWIAGVAGTGYSPNSTNWNWQTFRPNFFPTNGIVLGFIYFARANTCPTNFGVIDAFAWEPMVIDHTDKVRVETQMARINSGATSISDPYFSTRPGCVRLSFVRGTTGNINPTNLIYVATNLTTAPWLPITNDLTKWQSLQDPNVYYQNKYFTDPTLSRIMYYYPFGTGQGERWYRLGSYP